MACGPAAAASNGVKRACARRSCVHMACMLACTRRACVHTACMLACARRACMCLSASRSASVSHSVCLTVCLTHCTQRACVHTAPSMLFATASVPTPPQPARMRPPPLCAAQLSLSFYLGSAPLGFTQGSECVCTWRARGVNSCTRRACVRTACVCVCLPHCLPQCLTQSV
jgi:hypothetical protein